MLIEKKIEIISDNWGAISFHHPQEKSTVKFYRNTSYNSSIICLNGYIIISLNRWNQKEVERGR